MEGYIHISVYFEDLEKLSRHMLYQRIAWAIPIVGIGLILCILVAYRYTKPIPVLIEAIHSISRGNMPRLPTNLHTDIKGLSESLNALFERLETQKKLEEKLKRSENQAMLAQLASGIAHEIRNPLNFISLSIDHLVSPKSDGNPGESSGPEDFIIKIKTEIQRVNQMVTNFLDLGREFVLHLIRLRVDLLVEEALGMSSQFLGDRGISIERNYCVPIPVVAVDSDKMSSCFQNLIANAADATPRGGILRVSIAERDGSVRLLFEDNGEGIRPEDLPKLFEPYFTTKRRGIGLGLAITRRIVESHDGSIDITSTLGRGTRVRISLPSAPGDNNGEVEDTDCRG